MAILFATHERFLDHHPGRGHPESPARLRAVDLGLARAGLADAVVPVVATPATDEDLGRIHPEPYRRALRSFCAAGGGDLDGDTVAVPESWEAACLAAGAGIEVVSRLAAGEGTVGFCAVRPPGHHALASTAMGFCLFNNVAVTAAHLTALGERVAIVDYDAHHGNGTQDLFWRDPNVFYVSFHEWPQYPGTGRLHEVGDGDGLGTTLNLPLPSHTTGDVYRRALDEVVAPALAEWGATWLLISAGFDAHRADPITDLGLTSGDYADLTQALVALVPPGRSALFLEGGYDLDALADCTGAVLSVLLGEHGFRPEAATAGGPGHEVPAAALKIRRALADGYLRSP
jgi:acetoin utilization deacetylase AcuC-like enzyme